MHMAQRTARWTLAQLHRLPDDGNKYELVRGELFVTPAPTPSHEDLASVIVSRLLPYVEAQRLGRVHTPRAVVQVLQSEVEPDVMVRPTRIDLNGSWADAPLPILVIEIASDSTRRRDNVQKRSLYEDAGVAEYWIVDGANRTFRVVRRGEEDIVATESLSWHPAGATEPLVLDVAQVFHAALGDGSVNPGRRPL